MSRQAQSSERTAGHKSAQPVVQLREAGKEAVPLQDNRPQSIAQRKKRSNNTGLPNQLKAGLEQLSGHSMDDVKVHYGSSKPAQLNAHAFAKGTQIHLAPGQAKHLPHEAWHVVQQKQNRVQPTKHVNGQAINDSNALESEADSMGAKALQVGATVQRKPIASPLPKGVENSSNGVAQLEVYDVEWQTSSRNFSAGRRQGIKAGIQAKFATLRAHIVAIRATLGALHLPHGSELATALNGAEGFLGIQVTWAGRAALEGALDRNIAAAAVLRPQITALVAAINVPQTVRMQGLHATRATAAHVAATNVAAAAWVAGHATNNSRVPRAGGGTTDISNVLSFRNSNNVNHKIAYHNLQGFLAGGNYSELKDTAHSPGQRVLLDNTNHNRYWYGHNITHGGTTLYYWNGVRWSRWNNGTHLAMPYAEETPMAVPAPESAADTAFMTANRAGLTQQLNDAANPRATAARQAAAAQRIIDEAARAAQAAQAQARRAAAPARRQGPARRNAPARRQAPARRRERAVVQAPGIARQAYDWLAWGVGGIGTALGYVRDTLLRRRR